MVDKMRNCLFAIVNNSTYATYHHRYLHSFSLILIKMLSLSTVCRCAYKFSKKSRYTNQNR